MTRQFGWLADLWIGPTCCTVCRCHPFGKHPHPEPQEPAGGALGAEEDEAEEEAVDAVEEAAPARAAS
ncbi:MAG: hypothetical protein CMJ72_10890 [Planctomycetaceae bacterium]|nr:hypothetical protein [Planctomycetaceae bacterium]